MSHSLVPNLPESFLNLTIRDLIEPNNDFEVKVKGNKTSITRSDRHRTVSLEYTTFPDGEALSATKVHTSGSKKSRKGTVKKMRAEGRSQAEIARLTGMSQPYVSKLLKDDN